MKTNRSTLRTMRLVILVCQLGLFLRTEAQIPDACVFSNTNRPPENSDITVACGTEYMDLSIYLCPIYEALYDESLLALNKQFNKPECFGTADWNVDPPVLKFRVSLKNNLSSSCNNKFKIINEVGTGEFANFSNVQFVNISGSVTSIDLSTSTITYRQEILYKFSCYYPMQYSTDSTQIGVAGVSIAIRDNNGSFISTLSMLLYQDHLYRETLTIPKTGLNLKTRIYVAVKATNLTERFNVLLDRCYASTSPYPSFSTFYDLFVGCKHDAQTKVEINGDSQKALFSFEVFRFVEQKNLTISTFYLHCVTRFCEVSECSNLKPDCKSLQRLRKREEQISSNSTIITSPPILVGKLGTGVTARPTDMTSSYQTENIYTYQSTSSLSCRSFPVTVVAIIVCSVMLNLSFFV